MEKLCGAGGKSYSKWEKKGVGEMGAEGKLRWGNQKGALRNTVEN